MADDPVWATRTSEGWSLSVRVQPGASRTEVAGIVGEQLKVRVAAPPNDGRANAALLCFVGQAFGVRARDLRIRRGQHGRSKVLEVCAEVPLPRGWPS